VVPLWRAAAVLALAASTGAAQQPTFRSGVDLVTFGASVTDRKGGLVTGLAAADFIVEEDGVRQTLQYFADGGGDGPSPELHLGLLLDVSESMGDDIAFTKTAAVKFLNTLVDAVDVTVVDFDTEVRVARYPQSEFARLIERIRQGKARGWTALYDAIGVYLDGASGRGGRTIMLLYTDGGDTRSALSLPELLDLLKASDVTVYAIGELEHQSPSGATEARMMLQRIADVTGGRAFFPTSVKELDRVYEQVVGEIRAQYTLGYVSTNTKADGRWRKVEIKVVRRDGRDVHVRARKGYFARYVKP